MNARIHLLSIGLLSIAMFLAAGCRQGADSSTASGDSEVLAVVGDGTITLQEFNERLSEQPAFIRARLDSPEKKREMLDNLIRQELLMQEARRRRLDKDPEVQATLEKLMVQKLVRTVTESSVEKLDEAEVRKAYEAHLDEYVRPERVRVSHLLIAADRANPKRAQKKAEAIQLLAELKAQQGSNAHAFEARARVRSEDLSSRDMGGDLGSRTKEELEALTAPELAQAAFALRTVGELSGVIETDKGFHLLVLQARHAKSEQRFESVRGRLENRLLAERRTRALDTFITEMRAKAKVEIFEKSMEKLDVRRAPERATKGETQ